MAKLILVRHGQTDWKKQNRVQGSLDIPLNNEGTEEAKALASELSKQKIDAIYSSPSSCCFSTACEIATPHKLKVKKINELSELNQGVWQGLLLSSIKKRYKKQYSIWKTTPTAGRPPNGESLRDACDRTISLMHKIVDKHKDESICFVSGEMVLSIIKCYLKNLDLDKMWQFTSEKTRWEAFQL